MKVLLNDRQDELIDNHQKPEMLATDKQVNASPKPSPMPSIVNSSVVDGKYVGSARRVFRPGQSSEKNARDADRATPSGNVSKQEVRVDVVVLSMA